MSIKVAHINYNDSKGGAAIAVQRIHKAQISIGIKSKILVAVKDTRDEEIEGPKSSLEEIQWKFLMSMNRKFEKIEKKKRYDSNSYNIIPNNFYKKINNTDCDIVNLHWIGNNLIPIKSISKITKPIVWTLHDMWPYSGAEHYTLDDRFIKGYYKNNKPNDTRGIDLDRYCWNLKKKYYPKNILVVATSSWQLENVKKSQLLNKNNCTKICLPLDFNFWKPLDKTISRNNLNLPLNKKIILIGAENLEYRRKGFKLIKDIFSDIINKDNILVVFGRISQEYFKDLDISKILFLNEVKSNTLDLKSIYSASDLFIAPSIQESFGQTVLEAASCCLPSICFENNGMSEIIDHKINGYISKSGNIDDFKSGINWCLNHINSDKMSKYLEVLKNKFSMEKIGSQYKNLYLEILNNKI